jgi:translocation and assembly module TamA
MARGRRALRLLVALLAAGAFSTVSTAAAQAGAPTLQVTVEGIRGEVRDNVLSQLGIEQRRRDTDHTDARVQRLHRQAEAEIRGALEPFGYYRPAITSDLSRGAAGWHARYGIEPGPAIRLGDVDVRLLGPGGADPVFRERIEAFPLRRGDVLRHDLYELGKLELLSLAADRGYLQARLVTHRIAVDTSSYTASLALHLETGERHRFGEVRFDQAGFSEDLLLGFVPFRPGDPYATVDLIALQRSMVESDFFRSVDVRARPDLADGLAVPVHVTLEARPRSLLGFGAGYGTDTGPRASGSIELRQLNRFGHRFTSEARVSMIRNGLNTRYLIPRGSPGDQLALSVGFVDDRPRTHSTQSLQVGASLNHRRGIWREQLYVNVQQDWFEVGDTRGTTRLVLPGASWSRTRTDDPIHSTRGSRVQFDVRGTDEWIGSEVGFFQATLRGKRVRSPFPDGRLLVRGDLGYTLVDDFGSLPPTLRFFAGGDQSVRGYGYQALGPRGPDGEIQGGRHLVVGSVEYEQRLVGDWGAATFFDVGNSMNGLGDRLRQGAGAGIRWVSPVGLLRLDVASAISEPGRPLRLHIVIGPDL